MTQDDKRYTKEDLISIMNKTLSIANTKVSINPEQMHSIEERITYFKKIIQNTKCDENHEFENEIFFIFSTLILEILNKILPENQKNINEIFISSIILKLDEIEKLLFNENYIKNYEFKCDDKHIETWRNAYSERIKSITNDAVIELDMFKQKLENKLQESEAETQKIAELHNLNSSKVLISDYAEISAYENRLAMLWRYISLMFLMIAILLSALKLIPNTTVLQITETSNVYSFMTQASFTLLCLYASIYASQQSTRHRNEAQKNRSLGVQINTFKSYIKELEKNDQIELIKQMAPRFFVGAEVQNNYEESQLLPSVISAFTEWLKTAKPTSKP